MARRPRAKEEISKVKARAEAIELTKEFLAKGGKIQVLKPQSSD